MVLRAPWSNFVPSRAPNPLPTFATAALLAEYHCGYLFYLSVPCQGYSNFVRPAVASAPRFGMVSQALLALLEGFCTSS